MVRSIRGAAHRIGRHAFPAIIAAVIAVGAAGAGIGYAVASQKTAAPTSSPASSSISSRFSSTIPGSAQTIHIFQRALAMFADQTGQSLATIRRELAAGKSLDQVAGTKAPAIESQILAQASKLAGHAVGSGRMTAAQETAVLAMAKTKIDALMAEPGTQLLNDAQNAFPFLQRPGHKHGGASAAPTPTPTPTP